MWDALTQFCDGGELGGGAETGIATESFHAGGSVGLEQFARNRDEIRWEGQSCG